MERSTEAGKPSVPNLRARFWAAQAVWWGFYAAVFHVAALPQMADPTLGNQLVHFASKLQKAALGLGASLVLHALYRRWAARVSGPSLAAVALVASIVLGLAWELAVRAIYGKALLDDQFLRSATLPVFVLIAWSALYFAFVFRDRAAAEAERALRATALATAAELAMLRYQVNPHFLFNALNSLRALIDEDPGAARTMVTQLAELFRHSLRTAGDRLTVADEITAVRHYLDIQRIRFDDDLDAEVALAPDAAAVALPGFLIHPLVENAVKYGLETSPRPLRVRVQVALEVRRLVVVVTNTGRWIDDGRDNGGGTGTGLRNLRARLAHLYPGRHRLELAAAAGEVRARLLIELGP